MAAPGLSADGKQENADDSDSTTADTSSEDDDEENKDAARDETRGASTSKTTAKTAMGEDIDMVKVGCSTIATFEKVLAAAESEGALTENLALGLVVDKGGLAGAYVVAVWVMQQLRRLLRKKGNKLKLALHIMWCRQHAQATTTKEAVGESAKFVGAFPTVSKLEKGIRSWIACNRQRVLTTFPDTAITRKIAQESFDDHGEDASSSGREDGLALAEETQSLLRFYKTPWRDDLFMKYYRPQNEGAAVSTSSKLGPGRGGGSGGGNSTSGAAGDGVGGEQNSSGAGSQLAQDQKQAAGSTTTSAGADAVAKKKSTRPENGRKASPGAGCFVLQKIEIPPSADELPVAPDGDGATATSGGESLPSAATSKILNDLAAREFGNGIRKLHTCVWWELPAFTRWLRVIKSFSTIISQAWIRSDHDAEIDKLQHLGRGEFEKFSMWDRAAILLIAIVGYIVALPSSFAEAEQLRPAGGSHRRGQDFLNRQAVRANRGAQYELGFETAVARILHSPRDYELVCHVADGGLGGRAFSSDPNLKDNPTAAADSIRDGIARGLLASKSGELALRVQQATQMAKQQIKADQEAGVKGLTRGGIKEQKNNASSSSSSAQASSPAVDELADELYWEMGGGGPSGGVFQFCSAADSRASILALEIARQQLQPLSEQERHEYVAFLYESSHLMDGDTIEVEKFHRYPKSQQRTARSGAWKNTQSVSASATFAEWAGRLSRARKDMRAWFRREGILKKRIAKKAKRFGGWCELCRIFNLPGWVRSMNIVYKLLGPRAKQALRSRNVQRRQAVMATSKQEAGNDLEEHRQQYPHEAEQVIDEARCIALRMLEIEKGLSLTRTQVAEMGALNVEPCAHYEISKSMRPDFTTATKLCFLQPVSGVVAQAVGCVRTAVINLQAKIRRAMKGGQIVEGSDTAYIPGLEEVPSAGAATSSKPQGGKSQDAKKNKDKGSSIKKQSKRGDQHSSEHGDEVERAFCAPWALVNPDRSCLLELKEIDGQGPAASELFRDKEVRDAESGVFHMGRRRPGRSGMLVDVMKEKLTIGKEEAAAPAEGGIEDSSSDSDDLHYDAAETSDESSEEEQGGDGRSRPDARGRWSSCPTPEAEQELREVLAEHLERDVHLSKDAAERLVDDELSRGDHDDVDGPQAPASSPLLLAAPEVDGRSSVQPLHVDSDERASSAAAANTTTSGAAASDRPVSAAENQKNKNYYKQQSLPDPLSDSQRKKFLEQKTTFAEFLRRREKSAWAGARHPCYVVEDDKWGENKSVLQFIERQTVSQRIKVYPIPSCREGVRLKEMLRDNEVHQGDEELRKAGAVKKGKQSNAMASLVGCERVRRVITRAVKPGFEMGAKLLVFALVGRLRLVMMHYKKPGKHAALNDDEWRSVQMKFRLWMNQTNKGLLELLPDDDTEHRTAIEGITLDETIGRKLLRKDKQFNLMGVQEAAAFAEQYHSSQARGLFDELPGLDGQESDGIGGGPEDSDEEKGLGGKSGVVGGGASGGAKTKVVAKTKDTKNPAPRRAKPLRPGQVRKPKKGQSSFL
eukprot:g7615.t1